MEALRTYACYNSDKKIRKNSSSGGIFFAIACHILKNRGVVYGVQMSEDCYQAEFISITDPRELYKLCGSKYIQAKVGNTFKDVKVDLNNGKRVLFTGTACQINGLKKFLGKNYDELICVDVMCHGVPSPKFWKKYAENQEKFKTGKLKTINFRCKDISWEEYGRKENRLFVFPEDDFYMQMFLKNYSLRPSCYECWAKKIKLSDITIADFWGIDNIMPEMNDHKGTSLVIIRTEIGDKLFNEISSEMKLSEVNYKEAVQYNPAEYKSTSRPEDRISFFRDMDNMEFEELKNKYFTEINKSIMSKVKRRAKITINKIR